MSDVSIDVTTKGDVTGIRQIEQASTGMFDRLKKKFNELQATDPSQAIADRQLQNRQFSNLERKATELERKISMARLDQLQGVAGPAGGSAYIEELRKQREVVSIQRELGGPPGQTMLQRGIGVAGGVGRKGLRFGSMVAGGLGAYSLMSNIFGEMGAAGDRQKSYATAASQLRDVPGVQYSDFQSFFKVNDILKEMGETALATSKDMQPMLDVAKEMGDISGGASGFTGRFAKNINLAKMLGIDTGVLSQLYTPGLRSGGFRDPGQMRGMAEMLMLNPNMRNRGAESLQAFQQLMSGTTSGTQGIGSFGMFNLMNTLNAGPARAYRGAGGAQALLGVNQAFRGGGNENLQYFQTMALSPAFQEMNEKRLQQYNKSTSAGATDYKTGRYDQLISDVFKDLGAFATAGDVKEQLSQQGFKGAAGYVGEKYKDMGKMNIERLFDQYRSAYGAKDEGKRLFMTAQMSKDLGVGFSDVGVINKALQDEGFMKLAAEGGLSPEMIAKSYDPFIDSGRDKKKITSVMEKEATKEQAFQDMAADLKQMLTDLMPKITPFLEEMVVQLPKLTDGIVSLANVFGGGEKTFKQTMEEGFDTTQWGKNLVGSFDPLVDPVMDVGKGISKGASPLFSSSFWADVVRQAGESVGIVEKTKIVKVPVVIEKGQTLLDPE